MNTCRNPECGKEIPDGMNYCNEDCLRKHIEIKSAKTCPQNTKNIEAEPQNKNAFTDDLRDGAFQRGILWRKNKLEAIHKARQSTLSDDQIIRELRLGGITVQKARELMRDSEELLGR
jgi:hypothetical protein